MKLTKNKNGWHSPGDDAAVKKDLQKKYGWFSNILYMVLLLIISGYFLVQTALHINSYGIDVLSIIKVILFAVLIFMSLLGLKGIHIEYTQFKQAHFYVKTCRITKFRGEPAGKRNNWYVTVEEGDHETEYYCKNNPWLSNEQIAAKKEITIATFDDVTTEEEISMVYILDNVYPNYRAQ